jgi:phenylalanyl-tRNA synthetase alpha chain
MQNLKDLSLEEKKTFGMEINKFKIFAEEKVSQLEKEYESQGIKNSLKNDFLDITILPRKVEKGSIHPITKVKREIQEICCSMGFSIAEGCELEDDWHNFEALNTPPNHPARQMQDTFFMPLGDDKKEHVLRTQSTATDVREMERKKPPYKFISIGKTYRRDMDATHLPMFSQVDMQYIDKKITMAHLKYVMVEFCKRFFEIESVPMRFRPSFFPFTAPSIEVDIKCTKEGGKIVKFGEGNDWCEICGSGMTHPNVIKNIGLNPDEWQGFAFGFGIERMAMLKYGIADMRYLYEGDLRFLKHYSFKTF